MARWLSLVMVALALAVAPASAAELTGQYLEARTCDVWTGPCFANAEMNVGGRNAVLAWRVDKGTLGQAKLDGLGIVAVITASDTLGLEQTAPTKAILIVDARADKTQRDALITLAKKQGGDLVKNVIAVETAAVNLDICECKGNGCAKLTAGNAKVETRCLHGEHDKVCGNESAYYPPLVKGVKAQAVMASDHRYTGKAFNATWLDSERRGAYLGSFEF